MKGIVRALALLLMVALALPVFANGGDDAVMEETGEIVLSFPTFWVGQDSKSGPLATLLETFNNENAGEIKVVLEPNPDTDGYRDKLNTQLSSGKAPDIFVFNPDPTTFQYYDSDILFDFTDEMTGAWRDSFVESYVLDSTKGGRLKSVPYEIGITPVWYNSDLFAQAGVSEFPATWDAFMDAADKLKANGIVPGSQMTGGSNAWTSMLWFSHIMGSLGGPDVWSKPLTDPVYVEGAEYLKQLYADGNTTRDAVGGDAGVSGGHYLAGDTATFINGPWYIGRIRGDAPEIHAATKLADAPQVGDYYGHQIGFMLSNLAAGNTDSPRRRAAVVKFMKFMTEPANVQMVSESAGSLFAVKFELGADADPLQREFVRAASDATFAIGHFQSQVDVAVIQEFGQALAAMALDEATPEEFVQMLIDAQ
jgi:raffinose/stachyose/melibiose transport system substrate-binding protein